MSSRRNYPLPVPGSTYDQQNEAVTRRTIEIGFQQVQDTANKDRNHTSSSASLALRRHQFLLAGMS